VTDGPYVIGCDVGSQGTNAALYSADGTLVASAYDAYDLSFPHPSWAEQDPAFWTTAIERTVGRLVAEKGYRELFEAARIDGAGCIFGPEASPNDVTMHWKFRYFCVTLRSPTNFTL
jgi:xylulokinase